MLNPLEQGQERKHHATFVSYCAYIITLSGALREIPPSPTWHKSDGPWNKGPPFPYGKDFFCLIYGNKPAEDINSATTAPAKQQSISNISEPFQFLRGNNFLQGASRDAYKAVSGRVLGFVVKLNGRRRCRFLYRRHCLYDLHGS
jgi:hypothetical protein